MSGKWVSGWEPRPPAGAPPPPFPIIHNQRVNEATNGPPPGAVAINFTNMESVLNCNCNWLDNNAPVHGLATSLSMAAIQSDLQSKHDQIRRLIGQETRPKYSVNDNKFIWKNNCEEKKKESQVSIMRHQHIPVSLSVSLPRHLAISGRTR